MLLIAAWQHSDSASQHGRPVTLKPILLAGRERFASLRLGDPQFCCHSYFVAKLGFVGQLVKCGFTSYTPTQCGAVQFENPGMWRGGL